MFARGTAESKHKSNKNQDNEESHPGEQNQINEMMVERGEDLSMKKVYFLRGDERNN